MGAGRQFSPIVDHARMTTVAATPSRASNNMFLDALRTSTFATRKIETANPFVFSPCLHRLRRRGAAISPHLQSWMSPMKFFAALVAATVMLTACASTSPRPDANGVLTFSGKVSAIDTGCYVDGVCTATVDGVVVTTMTGERLNNPVWGEPNSLPAVGQRAEVRCLSTGPSSCTLKGSRDYHLRVLP